MEERAIRGIRWTLLSYGATRVTSLATTLVMARLLVPKDFGIVAFDSLLITGLLHFATLGLAPSLVIRHDLDEADLRTALSMMLGVYAACAAVLAAVSPLAGDLLGERRAGGVLLALSVPVLVGGLTSFYAAIMQRELQFRGRFICDAASVAVLSVTSIALAAAGAGVWSLVVGQIAGAAVSTVFLIVLAPYRTRPGFERQRARVLWRSGWGFVLQGGFSFIEQNADYGVIGATVGVRQLGLYSMAYRIGELPYDGIVDPIAQATFPGFARMRHRGEDVVEPFLTSLRLVAMCAVPLGTIAAAAAQPLVETLLGHQWLGMVGLLHILGIWGSVRVVQATIGWFVNSIGLSTLVGLSYAAMLAVSLPLVVFAAHLDGAKGVAWVMLGNIIVTTLIVAAIASHGAGVAPGRQWRAVRGSVTGSAVAWMATCGVVRTTTGLPPAVSMLASLGAGVATYAAVVWALAPGLPGEALALLKHMRQRDDEGPRSAVPGSA